MHAYVLQPFQKFNSFWIEIRFDLSWSQIPSTYFKMLTKFEAEFLKTTLRIIAKLKLAPFNNNDKKGKIASMKQNFQMSFSIVVVSLHILNSILCFWRIYSSAELQTKFLQVFLILVAFDATGCRISILNYHSEYINLSNHILGKIY